MTKKDYLRILKLLTALETAGMMRDKTLPDYILEEVSDVVEILSDEILEGEA